MNTRKDRLIEVYEHLRAYHGIHNKTDFANALQVQRPGLYSALNGNEAYLTDSLFKKICATFQGVFELQYLLTGIGGLLTIEEEVKNENKEIKSRDTAVDLYSKMIADVAELRHELLVELTEVRKERQQLQDTLTLLHRHLSYIAPASEIETTTATTMAAEPSPKTREK